MKFHEQEHKYINDDGEVYLSGTSFIKRFCKPFDKEKIAAKYAKKHKKKVEEVIQEWDRLRDEASIKGTFYHKIKEDELSGKNNVVIDELDHPVYKSIWKEGLKVNDIQKLDAGVYPELIVWSDRYKIAGQADYVEVTKKGFININDYKTSKEIKMHAFERWDGTKEMLKYPLGHLEDCKFIHYALQLNLYAFLIKQHNPRLKIGKLSIEHVIGEYDKENNSFTLNYSTIYKVPNLQLEIKNVLEYYKSVGNGY